MATPNFPSKRHISFYSNKEYTSVCTGINLKSRCTNPACESVRSMGGLVIVKCPDRDTWVYQDAVYDLPCPSCGTVLSSMQFSGVVFVRCEARVSIGDQSEVIKASQEETVSYEIEYIGPEVRIKILERESENTPPPAPYDISQSYKSPAQGVNLVGSCRRNDCLATKNNQGLVIVKIGLIGSAVFQDLVKFRNCPCCNHELGADSFNFITFVGCRAEIQMGERVEKFDAISAPKHFSIKVSGPRALIHLNRDSVISSPPTPDAKDTTVRDFALRDLGLDRITAGNIKEGFENLGNLLRSKSAEKEPTLGDLDLGALGIDDHGLGELGLGAVKEGLENLKQIVSSDESNDSSKMEPGINFMADCPNLECGSVVIPSGHIVSYQFKEAIRGMACPSCKQVLYLNNFTGVGFVCCKASVETAEKRFVYQAGQTPEIYKFHAGGHEVEITVLEREHKVASKPGKLSGGSGMEYARACSGLNIVASCRNTECQAYLENDGQVNIQVPNVNHCLLRNAASDIICPSCDTPMEYSQVKAITFVRCGGEVIIGDQHESFAAAGNHTAYFLISPDGPEVMINISYKAQDKKSKAPGDRRYTKVCDGVNFIAFCQNPGCLAVQEYDGFVSVKRDDRFVQRGGFAANLCNYNVEVQHLTCPSCGSHLDPQIARGVALVRCKGTIEIAGIRQNFEAKVNDFKEFPLNYLHPRNIIEYEVVGVYPHGPGLNVTFRCINKDCPGQNHPLFDKLVFIKFGNVSGSKVNELVLGRNCPVCTHKISISTIDALLFNECTAVVRIKGKETHYMVGSSIQHIPFEYSDNVEVDILPIIVRDISLMLLDDNPYFSLNMGLNVQAICSQPVCEAKRIHEGRVCISCPELKNSQLSELLSLLFCPSCNSPLSDKLLICLSFVQCKALLETSERKFLIKTSSDEVIDFENALLSPDLSIQVLSLEEDFPELKKQHFYKGSEYSHASLCHGLNFRVSCPNSTCVSVQNRQYVNIMSGHLLEFDYRLAVQSLICPCCSTPIPPEEVDGVTMLYCTGQVKIGDRIVKFDYSRNSISRISIPKDGSNVWVKVEHRTYDVLTRPAIAYLDKPFQSLCRGVNFRCYCKNALCDSFNLTDGLVNVQRNVDFVNTHGYSLSVCNYRDEISRFRCPDCSVPLPQYFVWGVVFYCCSGTITRNGSPPEKFCTPSGKVVLYALDRDDRSARIELSL